MAGSRKNVARLRAEAKRRGLKRCPRCGRSRRRSSFHRSAREADGLHSRCRDCKRAQDAARTDSSRGRGNGETPTHVSWRKMIDRCEQPSDPGWERYGERGVWVCDRWRDSFEAFLEDMGERPPEMTLDRIDPNGDYQLGNCRWATAKEQRANQRVKT